MAQALFVYKRVNVIQIEKATHDLMIWFRLLWLFCVAVFVKVLSIGNAACVKTFNDRVKQLSFIQEQS